MRPGSDQAHFMAMKCPKAILARGINISLGFSVGALKNATKISDLKQLAYYLNTDM